MLVKWAPGNNSLAALIIPDKIHQYAMEGVAGLHQPQISISSCQTIQDYRSPFHILIIKISNKFGL